MCGVAGGVQHLTVNMDVHQLQLQGTRERQIELAKEIARNGESYFYSSSQLPLLYPFVELYKELHEIIELAFEDPAQRQRYLIASGLIEPPRGVDPETIVVYNPQYFYAINRQATL